MEGSETRDRAVILAAWASAGLHALAGALSALFVAPGSPAAPLGERLGYLAPPPAGWNLAWLSWVIAGMALVWLIAVATRQLPGRVPASLAVPLAAAAVGVDATVDLAQISLLPPLAATQPDAFVLVERWLLVGGLVVANGLYTAAVVALTIATSRAGLRRLTFTASLLVAAGSFLVLVGLTGSHALAPAAAGATVAFCIVWSLHIGYAVAGLPDLVAG